MSIEDRLKELIIARYGNVSNFSKEIDMANSTLATIMKNGINKASISNIIKICQALQISTDELAKGNIVPISEQKSKDMNEILQNYKMLVRGNCTLDGKPLSETEMEMIIDSMEMTIELIRKRKERENESF